MDVFGHESEDGRRRLVRSDHGLEGHSRVVGVPLGGGVVGVEPDLVDGVTGERLFDSGAHGTLGGRRQDVLRGHAAVLALDRSFDGDRVGPGDSGFVGVVHGGW
ncbi:hypothetical protein [Halospeciosus flavus]|uniref:Uncharacterized protein n=1 Tax=Halospeciosus flavus TaxID=3032283 RepID=A0ABD5Z997_9EURY|nr:hypothetical protein [Halospeciosus flavus]